MTVTLPPELDPIIDAKMKSGGYNSPEELVAEALCSYQTSEEKIAWLKAEIQLGIDSMGEATEGFSADELMEELRREEQCQESC